MWYRKQLKEEAKKVFTYKDNYWKFVLAGLIILLLTGGVSGAFSSAPATGLVFNNGDKSPHYSTKDNRSGTYKEYKTGENGTEYFSITNDNGKITYSHSKKPSNKPDTQPPAQGDSSQAAPNGNEQTAPNNGEPDAGTNNSTQENNPNSIIEKNFGVEEQYSDDYDKYNGDYPDRSYMYEDDVDDFDEIFESERNSAIFAGLGVMVIVLIIIFSIIAIVVGMTFKAFLINPLILGIRKFFLKSYDRPSDLSDIGAGYKYNYIKNVGTLILKDIFTMLWSLLFIVPGIIKSYEYRMIPYLIAENPDMTYQEAFAKSKDMMMGNKWDTFVLDLSFLGWFLLNGLTCGILGIFFVNPYYYATDANLYRAIKMGGDTGYRSEEYVRFATATNTTTAQAETNTTTAQAQESAQATQETQNTTTQATSEEVDSNTDVSSDTDSKEE